MDITYQLYRLQELDLEQDKHQQRLKNVLNQLGETEDLRAARIQVTHLKTQLGATQTQQRNLEAEIQSQEAKLASVEESLYSGRVLNPKTLTDLQNESQSLRRWRGALDEKLLELMLVVEDHQAALNEAQAKAADIESVWMTHQHSLAQERAHLETELARLSQARAELLKAIPPTAAAQYEALRRDKNGVAMSPVEDGFCTLCGVELSDRKLAQLIQSDSPVLCGNCGRILVE